MPESINQKRFYALLDRYPRISEFWDRKKGVLEDVRLLKSMGVLSSGERVAAAALASIWMGSAGERFRVDLTDLAALSDEWRKPLIEWLINPFWP